MGKTKKQVSRITSESAERVSGSVEETQALGERLGRWLRAGDVVALRGELGTGKTTLVQGIARGLGYRPGSIKSPTFVLMREYPGDPSTRTTASSRGLAQDSVVRLGSLAHHVPSEPHLWRGESRDAPRAEPVGLHIPLIHVDGYRLSGAPAAAWLDLELLLSPRKITLIEWADRFDGLLPDRRLIVELSHVSANRRRLRVSAAGEWPAERLAALREALKISTSEQETTERDDGDSGD